MDSKVFKYVVTLADTGSYSRAAKELYITPQGLSSAIKRLESSIGVPLLKADHEGVSLTEYGAVFYRFSTSFESQYDSMIDEIEKIRRKESRTIALSVSTGLFNVIPREVFSLFNETSKTGAHVDILRTMVDHDCESCLVDRICDFALLNDPVDHRTLLSVPLHKDTMFLWVASDSPLGGKDVVTSADLQGMDLVCLAPNEYVTSRNFVNRLSSPPLSCTFHHADEMIEVLELSMKRGIPAVTVRSHVGAFRHEGYVGIPIKDMVWGFSIAYRQDRILSSWDEEFLSFIGSYAAFHC